jgi:pyridoxal 5'-phosphate synthase pdxT subunit
MPPTIAVLALQGAFSEHISVLKQLGIPTLAQRSRSDFKLPFDALIIPGGESTAIMYMPLTQACS